MKKEVSVYLESGRRPLLSESSRLLDSVTKRFRKNKQRQEQQASLELDARLDNFPTTIDVCNNNNFLDIWLRIWIITGTATLSVRRKEDQCLRARWSGATTLRLDQGNLLILWILSFYSSVQCPYHIIFSFYLCLFHFLIFFSFLVFRLRMQNQSSRIVELWMKGKHVFEFLC